MSSIMVVDDVTESQASTSAFLVSEGYDVATAAGGEQALGLLAKQKPSAILFQVLEPAKGVIEFIRRLAISPHALTVPVVIVTLLNEFQVGSFLNGVPGVRRILYSPCSPDILKDAVARAIEYTKR